MFGPVSRQELTAIDLGLRLYLGIDESGPGGSV